MDMETYPNATSTNRLITLHQNALIKLMLMTHYNITILESNLNTETCFKTFTGEVFETAVLDSCANTYVR